MTSQTEEVLIDNDKMKVTKVTIPAGSKHTPTEQRSDRVILNYSESHIKRHSGNGHTIHQREPGSAIYRDANDSDHTIENLSLEDHISFIIERK